MEGRLEGEESMLGGRFLSIWMNCLGRPTTTVMKHFCIAPLSQDSYLWNNSFQVSVTHTASSSVLLRTSALSTQLLRGGRTCLDFQATTYLTCPCRHILFSILCMMTPCSLL